MRVLSEIYAATLDIVFGKSDLERRVRALTPAGFLALMRPITYKDGVVSLFRYENPLIHDMIHALKYRQNTHVAQLFAHALQQYLDGAQLQVAILVPVPLASKRKSERGYNQIEFILSYLPANYSHNSTALVKSRNTKPQTSLKRKDRIHNLKGAFCVINTTAINGATIVLIDDVTTTGTTLKESRTCLVRAGATKVYTVALAR